MIVDAGTANEIFDIIAKEGKHGEKYIDMYREEFVNHFTTDGKGEHWYPTPAGSSIKVYFNPARNSRGLAVTFYAQTINTVHDKTLVEDATAAAEKAGFGR